MPLPRAKRLGRPTPEPPLDLLPMLGPEVLRVLAASIAFERASGEPPSAEVVERLAREQGASPGACLVMVRREIRDAQGRACPLGGDRVFFGPGIVRDRETCVALEIRSLPYISIRLERPSGGRVNHRDLIGTAEVWPG